MRRYGTGRFALVVFALGCDAQPRSDYQGEKLATLKGTVTAMAGAETTADLALLYPTVFPSDWSELGWVQRVPATGSFPSSFTIDLYTPPVSLLQETDYGMAQLEEYAFSIQTIAAVASTSPEFPVKMDDCIIGTTPEPLFIVYLDRDLGDAHAAPFGVLYNDGNYRRASDFFGVAAKGYHLVKVAGRGEDGIPTGYAPVDGGIAAPITITITETAGPDCRPPRQYPYDGGVP
jgi:hypothetical protein